MICLRKRI